MKDNSRMLLGIFKFFYHATSLSKNMHLLVGISAATSIEEKFTKSLGFVKVIHGFLSFASAYIFLHFACVSHESELVI